MKLRKLRIAWSVAWGVLAVLLIALWVRSYWWVDSIDIHISESTHECLGDLPGVIELQRVPPQWIAENILDSIPVSTAFRNFENARPPFPIRARGFFSLGYDGVAFPFWFLLLVTTAVGTAPWIRWRFTLRTLLIATTLVAVGLRLIAISVGG
jgi:hypothetical protein